MGPPSGCPVSGTSPTRLNHIKSPSESQRCCSSSFENFVDEPGTDRALAPRVVLVALLNTLSVANVRRPVGAGCRKAYSTSRTLPLTPETCGRFPLPSNWTCPMLLIPRGCALLPHGSSAAPRDLSLPQIGFSLPRRRRNAPVVECWSRAEQYQSNRTPRRQHETSRKTQLFRQTITRQIQTPADNQTPNPEPSPVVSSPRPREGAVG